MSGTAVPLPSPPCATKTRPTTRLAAALPALDIALRHFRNRAAHDGQSTRRGRQCPSPLRRHLLRCLPQRRHADPVLARKRQPMVTAEILLDARIAALRVGQFKGHLDEVPDEPGPSSGDARFFARTPHRRCIRSIASSCALTGNGPTSMAITDQGAASCRSRTRARLFRSTSHCCRGARPPISMLGAGQYRSSRRTAPRPRLLARPDHTSRLKQPQPSLSTTNPTTAWPAAPRERPLRRHHKTQGD